MESGTWLWLGVAGVLGLAYGFALQGGWDLWYLDFEDRELVGRWVMRASFVLLVVAGILYFFR